MLLGEPAFLCDGSLYRTLRKAILSVLSTPARRLFMSEKRFKNSESVNQALRAYLKAEKGGLTTRSTRTSRKRAAG